MNVGRLKKAFFYEAPTRVLEHIVIVLITMTISILIAVPLGVLLTRDKFEKYSKYIINVLNICQTIPSFALIAIALPLLGIGFKPSIIILVLQSILPITKNTMVGLLEVDDGVIEAAKGMGMSRKEILFEVELPLAIPLILSGIKTSTIFVVSSATLAGFIGAGGLGVLISNGLNLFWKEYIIVGAGLGALLAVILDRLLGYFENKITPLYTKEI